MVKKQNGITRYALYARCSSDEQAEGEFTTLDAQKDITTRHALARGGQIIQCYHDSGKTGTSLNRPGWKALLADARAKKFDAVIVTLMNRLGRGDPATIAEYLLKEEGVIVESIFDQTADDEAGYVNKSVNRLVDGIQVVQARKSTTIKMEEMFARGYVCGHIPYGYRKENVPGMLPTRFKDGKVKEPPKYAVLQEEDAAIVSRAFALFLETGTAARVREFLRSTTGRQWTTTETTRLLDDERYTGVALFGLWRKEDAHPAIVSREIWLAVQERRRQRLVLLPAQQDEFTYYLRGRVFCPHCGCPYTYAGATGRTQKSHYYVCRSVHRNGKASSCPVRRMPAARLHLSVLQQLHHAATHKTALHKMIAASGGWGAPDETLRIMRGQLGKQRQLWEMNRKNYTAAIGEGRALGTLLPALEKAEAELVRINAEMQTADTQIAAQTIHRPTAEYVADGWGKLFDVWSVLTEEEREEMLGAVVERVELTDKKSAVVDFVPFSGANLTTALSLVQPASASGSGGGT